MSTSSPGSDPGVGGAGVAGPGVVGPGVAVITGAGNGIGRSIARRLVAGGWFVVGVDRDADALDAVIADLVAAAGSDGRPAGDAVVGDVRDPAVFEAARAAAERHGELRAWVNNAGILRVAPLHLMGVEVIDEVLDVNLRAVLMGTREAVRSFLEHGIAGSIVNISSIHARGGFPGHSAYDASKGGIESFTRQVCVEYGHLGIRCNAVAPGAVNTSIAALSGAVPDRDAPGGSELAPMRRVSEPEEIAEAVAFLLESAPVSLNGHVLAVDNGMSAWNVRFPPDPAVRFASDPAR